MNKIYGDPADNSPPWDIENPPDILKSFIDSQKISPCKTLDIGCGSGRNSIYLARKGFDVTGVDLSDEAVKIARTKAGHSGVKCRFFQADLTMKKTVTRDTFDYILEWQVLHHIPFDERKQYINNVHSLICDDGLYLACSFSEDDSSFEGAGKTRQTSVGTTLFMSAKEELTKLYSPYFEIISLEDVSTEGKKGTHKSILALLQKKSNIFNS